MRPILAVDPGLTTGWATLDEADNRFSGEVVGVVEFMRAVRPHFTLERGSSPVLVCEDFIPRGTQALSWQPASLHIIGWLKGEADYYGWEFRLQSPSQAKSFATNEKLKRAGWWVPGQDHARDALRHLMTYLCVTERDMDLLRAVAP